MSNQLHNELKKEFQLERVILFCVQHLSLYLFQWAMKITKRII